MDSARRGGECCFSHTTYICHWAPWPVVFSPLPLSFQKPTSVHPEAHLADTCLSLLHLLFSLSFLEAGLVLIRLSSTWPRPPTRWAEARAAHQQRASAQSATQTKGNRGLRLQSGKQRTANEQCWKWARKTKLITYQHCIDRWGKKRKAKKKPNRKGRKCRAVFFLIRLCWCQS